MNPACRLTSVALIVLVITIVQAYVYVIPNAKHADLDGHCYYEELKFSVPLNETRQLPERCEQASCFDDYRLEILGCGSLVGSSGFKVTETDFSKTYPDCCPQLVKE